MSTKDNIEKIFKDQFESFEQTPSSSVWTKIERKMLFKHFLKYKPLSFNLWNILIITAISVSAIILINNPENKIENKLVTNNNTITKNVNSEKNKANKPEIIIKKLSDLKTNTQKNKATNVVITEKKSENQISDKEKNESFSDNITEENYANSELTNEEKVTVKLAEPHSDFSLSTSSACEPAAIKFLNTSENCDSFHWDFGNGETSSQKNPTFVFRTAGKYNVTLTVTSGRFSDSKTITITIYKKPDADFEISGKTKSLFKNDIIQFRNNSTNYSKCIWNFGDGNTSADISPSYSYNREGNYKISLICISEDKCADTAFLNNILIQDAKYKINFPTAFSPDKSGQNNGYWKNSSNPNMIFHPIVKSEVSNYRLRVYNKFGALVFESNNLDIGWNGFYKNSPAPVGVYVWECTGKFENGKTFKETGNLTLLYLRNQ